MNKCCVCRRARDVFKTVTLTESEREFVGKMTGKAPPETLSYCKACWKIATDKTQGAQLFKGMLQLHLQGSGVRDAEHIATEVQSKMMKKATPKPVS